MGANHKNWNQLIVLAGLTSLVGGYAAYAYFNQQNKDRAAFAKLPVRTMSPQDIWDAALKFSRNDRLELATDNRRMEKLLDGAEEISIIAEGYRKCAIMGRDPSVPMMVRHTIFKHWYTRWCGYFGIPEDIMEELFEPEKFTAALERAEALYEAQHKILQPPKACAFCGKHKTEVEALVAGPGVNICNECVVLSAGVIAGYETAKQKLEPPP